MTDEALRNYLGVLSFLLAAMSFLANERREAIAALHRSGTVTMTEKAIAVASVVLLFLAAAGLVASAWPAVHATALGFDDILRLRSAVPEAFVLGWLLLIAITLALGALVLRASKIAVAVES
jgi:hypothetical protein